LNQASTTSYYQSNHSKVDAISLIALLKGKTSKLAPAYLHTIPLILNVKQGSQEYQLFKSFGLIRHEINKIYRLRGRCWTTSRLTMQPIWDREETL